MDVQQLLENMLSFSMQQHAVKDKTIEGLQSTIADLQKQLAAQSAAKIEAESK